MYIHTHNAIPFSHKEKNEILPFAATWIDLQGLMLSEIVRQRKINTVCYCLYVESKAKTNEYDKAETDSQILRTN